jgi:hypothetical protein
VHHLLKYIALSLVFLCLTVCFAISNLCETEMLSSLHASYTALTRLLHASHIKSLRRPNPIERACAAAAAQELTHVIALAIPIDIALTKPISHPCNSRIPRAASFYKIMTFL